jgi:hypothetical protein
MRRMVQAGELAEVVRSVYGSSRRVADLTRLRGGAKKGVYRLALDDGTTAVLYVWSEEENFFPASGLDPADPFAEASGAEYFVAAQRRLAELGVRVPRIDHVDRTHRDYPADFALVEDVVGGTLEALIENSPEAAPASLDGLRAMLARMHAHHSGQLGKVALVEAGTAPQDRSGPQVVLDQALRHLALSAQRVPRLAAVADRVERLVRSLAAVIEPRATYGLIHGELGPDHVLVARDGEPVLIDLEGLMFFDIEWEHAFIAMRFGRSYERLRAAGLDEHRLRFYELAQSLSLIEGPLRIADGDYPDRDFMLWIANGHIEKVLGTVDRWSPRRP